MTTRVTDRVDDWEDRPFTGGYRALQDLAAEDVSGVIRAGGATLFMTEGVVVGIQGGTIEDFEDASGTCFEAPAPALPVLAVMQERSDEVRDKFYTEKTAIAEVDQTLSDGGFTGYIELAENVLSGDYYLVYHGGESMSVGFVGESARLIDGAEAFETADDEVGIYEVRQVSIDPIAIPEPSGATPADTAADQSQTGGDTSGQPQTDPSGTTAAETTGPPAEGRQDDAGGQANATESGDTPGSGTQTSGGGGAAGSEGVAQQTTREPETPQSSRRASESGQQSDDRPGPEGSQDQTERTRSAGATETADQRSRQPDRTTDAAGSTPQEPAAESDPATGTASGTQPQQSGSTANQSSQQSPGGRAGTPAAGSATRQDLETRAIPSLDPTRTRETDTGGGQQPEGQQREQSGEGGRPGGGGTQAGSASESAQQTETGGTTRAGEAADARASQGQPESPSPQHEAGGASADPERVAELESELEDRDRRIEELETDLEDAEAETAELESELADLRAERDDLAAQVEELESELERLETELGAATDAEERMTAGEALRGTDIFIRYHSKGEATLEKAHGGSTRREAVNENLRLEKHTQFDKDVVSVGGQAYAEFLESTVEYQFVEWVVRELLFEIRETGHQKALNDLYEALPKVDRAELAGVVEVVVTEDGQETRRQESFDIVLRDRMGNPLLVANLNDSREAATEGMMESLITAAERVGEGADAFAGAFLVTRSFFEPGALEMASEATQGGLLSRDKRKSFVNLSRKQGYHLCLVEARNENFHLAVPEL